MKKLFLIGALFCIFCNSSYGSTKASSEPANVHNGHGYVDLGLPSGLKWATCNVGASSPEEYGDYYARGEVNTKNEYTEDNCSTDRKYINKISGDPRYDVARKKWGDSWRMPTKEEFQELKDYCTWEWTTQSGHNGYKVIGPNGNSIFLPAAGYRCYEETLNAESSGNYWTATTIGVYSYRLYISSDYRAMDDYGDWRGYSVRPVLD